MSLSAPVGPLTPRDLDQLFAELPAKQKADLAWAAAAVRRAIGQLQEEPLTHELVSDVAATYFRATQNVIDSALGATLAQDPREFGAALQRRIENLVPRLRAYWGDTPAMIRLTRTLTTLFVFGAIAFKELYRVRSSPDWASKLDELKQLELNVGPSADPSVGLLRATVLCAAILDGMDKGLARERAILLIEKADEEAWPTAWLLANHELIPGIGKIRIPSYFAPQEPTIPEAEPLLKTPFAQALWAQRKKIEAEGLKRLDRDEVDAEVALRRGRPLV